jgi:DNA-binding transcriptional MerR regulator
MSNISDGWLKFIVEAKQLGLTHEEARKLIQEWTSSKESKE